ncbi:MAG: hypothetical protein DDT39_01392 [Firmicutes bacterium]|nr:hypothetical protein [candidate division NPL-UPA2 bacterium]
MSSFSFAGEASTIYHVRLLNSAESVLPPSRERVVQMSGLHGALRLVPDLGERVLTLECWLDVATHPFVAGQRQARLTNVAAWLNPLRGMQRLIFDTVPDRYYWCVVTDAIDARVEARQGMFPVRFTCADPFVYAISPVTIVMTASPHTFTQAGTAPADPLLRLQGTSTGTGGQQISIAIGGRTLVYRGPLAAGDWLEIDAAAINSPWPANAKTVVRVVGATRTNVLPHMERPIFPTLPTGANTITVTPAGGATWSRLDILTRSRWI